MTEQAQAQSSGCPYSGGGMGEKFKPYEQEGMFEILQEARESEPVFYNKELDAWVVTRKADVMSVFRDPDRYSASNAQSPINEYSEGTRQILIDGGFTREPTHANTDRPKHGKMRNIAGQYLNMKNFATFEPRIRELTRQQLSALEGKQVVDMVDEVTYELPVKVLFQIMGIPLEQSMNVKNWSENNFNMIWGKPTEEQCREGAKGILEYWNFIKGVVAERSENLGDDYISHLLRAMREDDSFLTLNLIHSSIHGLLGAGHETTSNGSANLLWALLKDREQWRKLVDNPSLIPNAVEEGLRYMTPFITWRRLALEDVEIGGVSIPKDSTILMSLVSANHDEAQFECPMKFDIERKNSRQHMAFGNGIHFCMGAPLARLEIKVLLEELTTRYPNMSLVEDQKLEWPINMGFRGPKKLMINLGE